MPITINNAGGLYYQNFAMEVLQEQFGPRNVARDVMLRPINGSGGFGKPFKFDAICRRSDGSFVFNEFKGSLSASLTRPNQAVGHPLFQQFGAQVVGELGIDIGLPPGQVISPTTPSIFYNQFSWGQFYVPFIGDN
jgi:hypothetical protein